MKNVAAAPYCEDCRWFIPSQKFDGAHCANGKLRAHDTPPDALVCRTVRSLPYCTSVRACGNQCGIAGDLFELRPPSRWWEAWRVLRGRP